MRNINIMCKDEQLISHAFTEYIAPYFRTRTRLHTRRKRGMCSR